ncbi:MBL fold metallo-hydrolase [Sphingomonas sp. G-3-2-10]|uniref:MBL fold metallo-hydrolase n=1 Tax=Sphingomonas sp. G-3-2-10 TaxID=2728838 RepID=UPI00321735C5
MTLSRAILTVAAALTCAVPAAAETACPAFRWITLGTAGGPVPTPERSEPANLLVAGDRHILVDTGDGTVGQMAKIGVQMGAVDTVLISHLHLDHSGGLAAAIGLRWMNQFPGKLTVYGPPGTRQVVDGIVASMGPPSRIGFGLGVPPPSPADSVAVVEIGDGARFALGDLTVRAVANSHFDHEGDAKNEGVSLSYRFELGGRSITYTGDTGPSAAVETLAMGSDMLVSEVIDLERLLADIRKRRTDAPEGMFAQMSQHLSTHHLTAADLGKLAAKANVARLVLTHFAVPGPLSEAEPGLRAGVRLGYFGPVDLARDLSSFDIGCAR